MSKMCSLVIDNVHLEVNTRFPVSRVLTDKTHIICFIVTFLGLLAKSATLQLLQAF